MSFTIRLSHRTQLWCLQHPGLLSKALLSAFYTVELGLYTVGGPKAFLQRRGELLGPNFAALGRLIVGEHGAASGLIERPQQRGDYLGRARLKGSRLPHGFLLSLSDADGGGDGLHETLRNHLWTSVVEPAQGRLGEPQLQAIVDAAADEIAAFGAAPTSDQVTAPLQRFTIRYMFRSLFQVDVTDSQVDDLFTLFFSLGLFSDYTASKVLPTAPPEFLLGKMNKQVEAAVDLIEGSPALADYVPSDANAQFTKRQWAELLTAIVGIAALGGGSNLAHRMVAEYPPDHRVDLSDLMAVTAVVLESARRHAPVNNVNTILPAPATFTVDGKAAELPAGAIVAASIGLASLDPEEYPNPDAFDPHRTNLESSLLVFNGVRWDPDAPSSRRTCPGRNVAVAMGVALFRAWRTRVE